MKKLLLAILLVFVALGSIGCDGKPCTDKPDYSEYDEELDDALDDMLDEAEAYKKQRERVFLINKSLGPHRAPFRVSREELRAKMIDALVAVEPDPPGFHKLIDDMYGVFMKYVHVAISAGIKAHRWFTNEQRISMTEDWEEEPDPFEISWTTNRGIDLALLEISATDPQKKLIFAWRDKMEVKTNALLKDQHAVRMKLIKQWHATKIDPPVVRKHIDEGANQISTFMHIFADAAMEVTGALTPKQRLWTNKQVNKLRRCSE